MTNPKRIPGNTPDMLRLLHNIANRLRHAARPRYNDAWFVCETDGHIRIPGHPCPGCGCINR